MATVKVYAKTKHPAFPLELEYDQDTSIEELKKKIAQKAPKFSVHRQKLSAKAERAKAFDDELKVSEIDPETLKEGLQLKDLGPQIGWRTVYLAEYAGALVIHPLIYHFPEFWYGKPVIHSKLQTVMYALIMINFVKRELETLFVHRFSKATMPFHFIFKNCGHYWFLSGLFLAYDLYRPTFGATSPFIVRTIRDDDNFLLGGALIWAFFELSNFKTHLTVRNLRPAGSKKRAIPYGYGFGLVSFPNYLFETLAWLVVCVMTQSYASYLFLIVGAGQMLIWAAKKHRAYKKEFGKEYPRGRKAMIPFIF